MRNAKVLKSFLKIAFVIIVISGLVGSYVLIGLHSGTPTQPSQTRQGHQQANSSDNFSGPTDMPNANGPTEAPFAEGPTQLPN